VQEAGGSKGTALTGVIQEYKGSVYDRYSPPPTLRKTYLTLISGPPFGHTTPFQTRAYACVCSFSIS